MINKKFKKYVSKFKSKREASRELGVNYQSLYNYCLGKNVPRITTIRKIAKKSNNAVTVESWT